MVTAGDRGVGHVVPTLARPLSPPPNSRSHKMGTMAVSADVINFTYLRLRPRGGAILFFFGGGERTGLCSEAFYWILLGFGLEVTALLTLRITAVQYVKCLTEKGQLLFRYVLKLEKVIFNHRIMQVPIFQLNSLLLSIWILHFYHPSLSHYVVQVSNKKCLERFYIFLMLYTIQWPYITYMFCIVMFLFLKIISISVGKKNRLIYILKFKCIQLGYYIFVINSDFYLPFNNQPHS